jgi:predicted hotdog family 3-hydroxylacyl-ACP dehydratase
VVLPLLCGLACAARQPTDRVPQAVQTFVADVGEDEWQRAVPAKGSTIASPRLIRGKKQPDDQGVLAIGETATATVAQVIRADGTVGLYRVVASSNARFTERVIQMLRSQVYEPPLLNGSPVAIRGEVSFQVTRTQ